MQISLKKDLFEAGLSENEAAVYLAVLELGETIVSRIAKKSAIKRTTVYLVIESLKEKGLIVPVKKNKKTYFYAEDPRKLIEILERRKENLGKVMPQLLAFTNLIDKKPEIRYFEGKEGIKEVYRDSLKYPGHEMTTWFSDRYSTHFDESYFYDDYMPKRVAKKIPVRAILPDNEAIKKLIKYDVSQLRQSKIINNDLFHLSIELNMYGGRKVGIVSYEEQFALIIDSKRIHESLKSIFEMLWKQLP